MVKLYINLPSVFIYAQLILWIAQGGVNDFSLIFLSREENSL